MIICAVWIDLTHKLKIENNFEVKVKNSLPGCDNFFHKILHKIGKVFSFYLDGFRSMRTGKTLWKIIFVKIILFVAILKFFFPDYLQTNFSTDQQRADHVLANITKPSTGQLQGGK
ncbi:MAG: DUF4492 domain-containing protein [Pseudomonadota bacterium]|nr:DUF4492 domain-containing protein [Pseudomonadota bacterium]